jgi:hypothetical protein
LESLLKGEKGAIMMKKKERRRKGKGDVDICMCMLSDVVHNV